MRPSHLAYTFIIALLGAAGAAHADPLSDFAKGSRVLVTVAVVEAGGNARSLSGDRVLEKRSGSLDFDIPAEDLGLGLPVTLHLRGVAGRGGRVEFEIDEVLREPVYLDGEHRLTRVTGHLAMRARPLPGTERSEVGGTFLEIADKSYVVATGDWGDYTIPVTQLIVRGGVPQPPLAAFVEATGTLVCSDRVMTRHVFEVSLADDARDGGALVLFHSDLGAGVLLPGGVYVAAGRRKAFVNALVEPDFVGRARVSAAAGGVERVIDIEVHPARDCERR